MRKMLGLMFLLIGTCSLCFAQATTPTTTTGFPRVVAHVSLTGQSHGIPSTTVFTPTVSGLYRISAYMTLTVPQEQVGDWILGLGWNDDAGTESTTLVEQPVSATPPFAYETNQNMNTFTFWAKTGIPVTYNVTVSGNPTGTQYELFFTIERLL
jgi:hypothetical protein